MLQVYYGLYNLLSQSGLKPCQVTWVIFCPGQVIYKISSSDLDVLI